MLNEAIFKNEEKAVFALRGLYKQYGYLPFKMSKFEEYDLYVQNKDFLVSDSVITFTDRSGKLLALKPDVTLSIIKNTRDEKGVKQKVYYDENVYRVSGSTHEYKEIMQAGLECIGDIDAYDVFEVIYLAAKSLATISSDFVLDLSHMGIFAALLDETSDSDSFKREVTKCISEKNPHETVALCERYGISADNTAMLVDFIKLYGNIEEVLPKLSAICKTEKQRAEFVILENICNLLMKTEYKDNIKLDFSVVNDMNYYNGIVFKGFLSGICEGVLSGGEYGRLMRRMGRKSNAVGFALYLDLLEDLNRESAGYDVDVLLVYSDEVKTEAVYSKVRELTECGKTVSAQKKIPEKIRYKELLYMESEA